MSEQYHREGTIDGEPFDYIEVQYCPAAPGETWDSVIIFCHNGIAIRHFFLWRRAVKRFLAELP